MNPVSISELQAMVRSSPRVLPRGGGTKSALSGSHDGAAVIDLTALAGMLEYEPGEFVFTALAGTRLADVRAYEVIIRSASLDQLHALRITFKKLRYAIEFFREVLGEEAKEIINRLRTIQDHLGNLNDTRVACQLVAAFLENWDSIQARLPVNERLNPVQVVAYLAELHAIRHRLMVSFPAVWDGFHSPEMRQTIAKAMANL